MSELFNDPHQLASACSDAMHANDDASKLLGIEIIESRPGHARLQLTVSRKMTNGHDICHGGFVFTLADSAFAHACNNTNRVTVASGCSIEFLAPGAIGDVLTATASERSRSGRTGVYDVDVTNQNNELIAVFRGKSYQIKGQLIDQPGEPT
ncbi:MAG: hydroxyphenylacetyl-CoA thioesterase PaaI [Gammaproteobacteria bacterium]|nr:hydroxyphenylacetyl-CoA thioesterase PaaI [Gammaproteobacteria bacterium]